MRFVFVAFLGSFLSFASFAEPPELLVPIEDAERAIVEANNPYFLPKETYVAKRYRIVTVNTELLLNARQIKITPFDGRSVTLETVEVEADPKALDIAWEGRYLEPRVSVDELVAGGMDRKTAENLLPDLNRLRIFASQVSFDESTRLKYSHLVPRFQKFRVSGTPLYNVTFQLPHPRLPETYHLVSLASDPRHHVLIEPDPGKICAKPTEPGGRNAAYFETPENLRKCQQYREFLHSLGPDPRPPDMHKQ
jgi:hypothetical protein